jgi:hypothetical protein
MRLALAFALLACLPGCRSGNAAAPAPDQPATIDCGPVKCRASEYCHASRPNVPPNVMPKMTFTCRALPDPCRTNATCDCLSAHGVAGTCRVVGGGPRVIETVPIGSN